MKIYCEDCKFYKEWGKEIHVLGLGVCFEDSCLKTSKEKETNNIVIREKKQSIKSCKNARGFFGICGRKAKLFEPKES